MGGAASIFRRKKKAEEENQEAEPPSPEQDELNALRGVEELMCRVIQTHYAGSERRWERITRKVNLALRKNKIAALPIKTSIERNGGVDACIPEAWREEIKLTEQKRLERLERKRQREVAAEAERLRIEEEERERKRRKFMGTFTLGRTGKGHKAPVVGSSDDLEGSTDGEEEDEEDIADREEDARLAEEERLALLAQLKSNKGPAEPEYTYEALSKYEVFSYMRRLHVLVGTLLREGEDVPLQVHEVVERVKELYKDLPAEHAKAVSQENRRQKGLLQDSLAYGELEVEDFAWLFLKIRKVHGHFSQNGGNFWDLGSGVGKLVICAALLHDFEAAYGVEALRDLRDVSRPVLDRCTRELMATVQTPVAKRTDFILGDALQQSWPDDASCIFVHANFDPAQRRELLTLADTMKVGSLCLSVSAKAVTEDKWGLLAKEEMRTSWGGDSATTTVFVHEKLTD